MNIDADLNEVVKDMTKKMIEISDQKAPIVDFSAKTIKMIDNHYFDVDLKISQVSTNDGAIFFMTKFLQELEDIERGHKTIEKIIDKYKKLLLIKR